MTRANILNFIPRNRNAAAANKRPGDKVEFRSCTGNLCGTVHDVIHRAIEHKHHRIAIVYGYTVSVNGERMPVPVERIIMPTDGVA